jgi:hypothetical protein
MTGAPAIMMHIIALIARPRRREIMTMANE